MDGDHRQTLGLQFAVAVVGGRQAAGDKQRIATAGAEQLQQLPLTVGVVVGAGDQQLIAAGTGALFEQLGDACVTGVFQVRQDKTQGTGVPAAQPGGLGVGRLNKSVQKRSNKID